MSDKIKPFVIDVWVCVKLYFLIGAMACIARIFLRCKTTSNTEKIPEFCIASLLGFVNSFHYSPNSFQVLPPPDRTCQINRPPHLLMYIRLHLHTYGCPACTQRFLQALVCRGSPERAWKPGGWNRAYAAATLRLFICQVPAIIKSFHELSTYIHACMPTDKQTERPTDWPTDRRTYVHMYVLTQVHSYIGT